MRTNSNSSNLLNFITSSALVLLFLLPFSALSQDCNCDYTITPSQGFIRAVDVPAVKPGSTVCIKSGVRGRLKLIGFKGTQDQPITFKNCGGQVIFDNPDIDGTFVFESCKYFRVTGTGDPGHEFGFLIRNAGKGSAMYVTESDFEIDHIEIADAGFAGIMAKIDPTCDNPQYYRENFVMRNVSIHDNYIHHTYGEGMYIGSTSYTGKSLPCGTKYPHLIEGLRVFNNRVEYTDADGIQVSSATKDIEVYNNTIFRYGQNPFKAVQNNGLMIGGGANGKYYNNKIIEGSGMGINCFGLGNVYMYNNLVVRPGYDGIFIDERSALTPNTGFHAHNNTVVSPGRDGIRMYSRNSVGNTFNNNLLVAPASLSIDYYNKNQYLYIISNEVKYTQSNNLFVATVKDAMFVDPANNNYQLQQISPAVEKGTQLNHFNFDHNRTPRPQGNSWDVGAYEYSGNIRNTNSLPVVSAGSDKALTLPTNSTSLTGSATDADGSIASIAWTKVSGPAATMSGTTTQNLGLSNLVEGTYTFRLTAKDNTGASSYDDVNVVVGSTTAPTSPSGLAAPSNVTAKLNSNGSVSLTWKDNSSNESGFEISMRTSSTSYKVVGSTGSNKISYTVGGLSTSNTYYVRLRAKNSSGYSAYSNEAGTNGTTTASEGENENTESNSLGAPTALAGKLNSYNTAVGLSWKDNSSSESGFEIFMSTNGTTSYKQVGSTGPNKTTYTVSVAKGQTYSFKIRAKGSDGYSAYSNEATVNTSTGSTARVADEDSSLASFATVSAYPNPASNFVDIELSKDFSGNVSVQLMDMAGRIQLSENVQAGQQNIFRLDLTRKALQPGMYLIQVVNGLQQQTIKLLKK